MLQQGEIFEYTRMEYLVDMGGSRCVKKKQVFQMLQQGEIELTESLVYLGWCGKAVTARNSISRDSTCTVE